MHFPLFVDLEDKPCLVVGDGAVARRKREMLAEFGARVTTVAPETTGRGFADSDVEGQFLVVAATDDAVLNARVAALCRDRGIPVNVVDDPANCTFVFPAVSRKGPLVAAVSSGGTCPVAAKVARDRMARALPDDFVVAVESLAARREEMKRLYPDVCERRRKYEEALQAWNV